MKNILFLLFAASRGDFSCNPFELQCTVREFVITVDENCLDNTTPIETISANYQTDELCKVKIENGSNKIRFLYSECETVAT